MSSAASYSRATNMARVNRLFFEKGLWNQGCARVAGVDEAGRGPLAGPVYAAAVVFPSSWCKTGLPRALRGLNDSKQLTPEQREYFFAAITSREDVLWQAAQKNSEEVDQLNILRATHAAMNAALAALATRPEHVLVDGLRVNSLPFPQTALVGGDARSFSIAAASVIAKVLRDRLMVEYHRVWPHYGFAEHKGYPTERHFEALAEFGPCPIHRRSFSPLRPTQTELL
jgi:ribonuclease HII